MFRVEMDEKIAKTKKTQNNLPPNPQKPTQ
jgi:hypothetical protein